MATMSVMGPAPTPTHAGAGGHGQPCAASILCATTPEVATDDDDRVWVSGTMYHDGLNANAWGLTEAGAQAIADSLVGMDFTASHPPLRGDRYDRAIYDGQGMPIGTVVDTAVTTADEAMLDGGEYTADYTAEILDPVYKQRFQAGLRTGDEYGVSVGIYADPDDALCSACGDAMTDCDHDRFDEVEASDGATQVAGPLYPDGAGDHLASVYLPAYDHTTADVTDAQASPTGPAPGDATAAQSGTAARLGVVPHAATVLAAPFDAASAETAADAAIEADADAAIEADADADTDAAGVTVTVPTDADATRVASAPIPTRVRLATTRESRSSLPTIHYDVD